MGSKGLVGILSVSLLALCSNGCIRESANEMTKQAGDHRVVFRGTVVTLAPSPGAGSGGISIYQLAKYRVVRVCVGQLDSREVVVDHLILTGDELGSVKVGDTV